jgi:hypothetical protein
MLDKLDLIPDEIQIAQATDYIEEASPTIRGTDSAAAVCPVE